MGTTASDKDHLLLNPKDVGLLDLIKLLFFKNIGDRKFIKCRHGTTESFSRRFVIFISIIAQRIFHLLYKPLNWVGSVIEFMPNLKYINGGFFNLLLNIVSGKMVLPDKESPDYLTTLGLWDIRRDLDSRIKHEDPRYTSALAIMAAKIAYENEAYIRETVEEHWKMKFLMFFDCWNDYEEDYTTQGFMWSGKKGDSELIGVCFRGTSPFNTKDWSSDVDLSWYELPGIGKVHAGFSKALGLQNCQGWPNKIQSNDQKPYAYYVIRERLKECLKNNPNAKFLVTGHSLGAALSILFPAILAYHKETDLLSKLEGVYTFGQPRVGDRKFGEYMIKEVLVINHGLRYRRYVYCNDLVPRVPFDRSGVYFKHFGDCLYFDSFYKGQVIK
ncbi:hypothetical protein R6Q59_034749 [Mikania micrantha]